MSTKLLSKPNSLLCINLLLLTTFSCLALSGFSDPLNEALINTIKTRPLAKGYFILFFLLGVLLPSIIRFIRRKSALTKRILNPYLLFLAGQISTEIIIVCISGEGLTVIVGLIFSSLRVVQLIELLPFSRQNKFLKLLILILLILWTSNVLQIAVNRIYLTTLNQFI